MPLKALVIFRCFTKVNNNHAPLYARECGTFVGRDEFFTLQGTWSQRPQLTIFAAPALPVGTYCQLNLTIILMIYLLCKPLTNCNLHSRNQVRK